MSVSNQVKSLLALCSKRQIDLAEYFGMSKQAMNNKINRDSWSARDLIKVSDFVGAKLVFRLPNGQQIIIHDDEVSGVQDSKHLSDKQKDPDSF